MNLLDEIQKCIGSPDNKYPSPYMKGASGNLHIWMIDPKKAAEKVVEYLQSNKDEVLRCLYSSLSQEKTDQ